MKNPTIHKGIFYFETCKDALSYATKGGYSTGRIVAYTRGFAIQYHTSGPYVGPATMTHTRCAFCQTA